MPDESENNLLKEAKDYLVWNPPQPEEEKGIITASNSRSEWLLPWWHWHLRTHSLLPVTFVDYGMTSGALAWCRQRGEVKRLDLPLKLFSKRSAMHKRFSGHKNQALIQEIRLAWFKKPFAMLRSPYQWSLWLDLDCEVRGDIAPVFFAAENSWGAAASFCSEETNRLKQNEGDFLPGERGVNSGVIPYLHGSELIVQWAQATITHEKNFLGDQDILSGVINDRKIAIGALPEKYNWRNNPQTAPKEAVIVHWWGNAKSFLKRKIMEQFRNS